MARVSRNDHDTHTNDTNDIEGSSYVEDELEATGNNWETSDYQCEINIRNGICDSG